MADSRPSLTDGSYPSAAVVQSASDIQCSRFLKMTAAGRLSIVYSQTIPLIALRYRYQIVRSQ